MKSPITQQQPTTTGTTHSIWTSIWTAFGPLTSKCALFSGLCPALAFLTYYFNLSVCWVRINRLCLEIEFLALLPSRLCPQKLPSNHLFGLHFLHSANDWKLLSLLFIFYSVSLYVFVPPQSPDWVYLPGCLPALVILCWKANLKPSNVLPFFYCCFCKESSNKQMHPTSSQHLVPFRTLKLMAWMSMWKERQDSNPANLQKLGMDPKEQTFSSLKYPRTKFVLLCLSVMPLNHDQKSISVLFSIPAVVTHFATWAQGLPCASIYSKRERMQGPACSRIHWTKGLEPVLCNFKRSVASIRSKVNFPFFCLNF